MFPVHVGGGNPMYNKWADLRTVSGGFGAYVGSGDGGEGC